MPVEEAGGKNVYQKRLAYLFSYRNGVRQQSVGVLRRCKDAEAPEVLLELLGKEEQKKEWRIYYFTCRETLQEASFFWETVQGTERNELPKGRYRLCTQAGLSDGVVLLPEAVAKVRGEQFGWPDSSEFLCGRFDGAEVTQWQIQKAFAGKQTMDGQGGDCIRSAQRLVEEFTKAAAGEETDIKEGKGRQGMELEIACFPKRKGSVPLKNKAEKNHIACLEELLLTHPSYLPCREQTQLYTVRLLPEELLRLPKEGRRFAENSFLLHGYYSYRHLLLGRRRKKEQEDYVLLVPGRYGSRDAQLAGLFGFSEFIPAYGEMAHAAPLKGCFGYWGAKI